MSLVESERAVALPFGQLRWRWTAALVVGEFVGFLPPALTGVALVALDASDPVIVVALTVAGVLEGLALGIAQVGPLRSTWPEIDGASWVKATALAAGLAWLVGMGGSSLVQNSSVSRPLAIGLLAVAGPIALLSMGFLQWLVLRRVVSNSGRWVPVTAGAWMIGVAVPVISLSAIPNSWPPAAHLVVAVAAAVVMGLIVGALTGGTLEKLAQSDQHSGSERVGSTGSSLTLALRFMWTVVSCFVVESVIVGLAAVPAVAFYQWHLTLSLDPYPLRIFLLAAALLPAYVLFAVLLMTLSAEATRLLGWRPPPQADLRISELPIELRNWARYAIISHLVHVMAGSVFRSTPLWVWYMRRNGAKVGRHVWVNSLQVGDDCLLDLGDEVVIGAGVHLAAHTVERGLLRLAPVHLGPGTTVGVGAHIGIGVTTGRNTQIGSMSVVPKFASLDADTTYVGIPARAVGSTSTRDEGC